MIRIILTEIRQMHMGYLPFKTLIEQSVPEKRRRTEGEEEYEDTVCVPGM